MGLGGSLLGIVTDQRREWCELARPFSEEVLSKLSN